MKYTVEEYELMQNPQLNSEQEFGCGFCWDRKKNRSKELFFLDAANNMRICDFCPSCGRKYNEEK